MRVFSSFLFFYFCLAFERFHRALLFARTRFQLKMQPYFRWLFFIQLFVNIAQFVRLQLYLFGAAKKNIKKLPNRCIFRLLLFRLL